jgi:hypothetical protein
VNAGRAAGLFIAVGIGALGAGCAKSESAIRAEERARLEPLVVEDERAARAMSEADHLQRKGDIIGALDTVDTRAKPAIEAGLRIHPTVTVRSDWGRAQHQALGRLLEGRLAQIEPYREAILSNDEQKLVSALEAQVRLDRRALEIVTDLRASR